MRARVIGGLPADLVGSLTGLTQGRFPVARQGDLRRRSSTQASAASAQGRQRRARRSSPTRTAAGSRSSPTRGAPVIAVNDGRIVRDRPQPSASATSSSCRTSTATRTRTRTWARSPTRYPAPKPQRARPRRRSRSELALPDARRRSRPRRPPTTDAARRAKRADAPKLAAQGRAATRKAAAAPRRAGQGAPVRPPRRARTRRPPAAPSRSSSAPAGSTARDFAGYFRRVFGLDRKDVVSSSALQAGRARHRRHDPRPHRQAATPSARRTCCFEIRPAGRGAPRIDPKPILDGWKLLESTAIYRANGQEPVLRRRRRATRRSARSC